MKKAGFSSLVWAILALLIAPILPLLIWSGAARWPWPDLLPPALSSRAWSLAFEDHSGFLLGLALSCGIATIVTFLALLVSLPLARLLGLCRFRGKSFLEVLVILPLLVPGFVAAMGLHETFLHWSLTDTFVGVVLIHLVPTTPYMVRALATGFALLGTRLEDQARTLGAGPLRIAWSVTLPRLLPAIVVGSTFVFVASIGEYLLTLLIGGSSVPTLPLQLYPYIASGDRPIAAAGSLLLCAGPLAAILLIEAGLARHYSFREKAPAKGQNS